MFGPGADSRDPDLRLLPIQEACRQIAQPEAEPALRALITGAFAHRRKTLVGSLALAGAPAGRSREQVREALEGLHHPGDARAERLSPADFRALAKALEL